MGYARKQISGVLDLKSEDGLWVRSYSELVGSTRVIYNTRAGCLWSGLTSRLKSNRHYSECSSMFKDFQEFAEWCQSQTAFGYMQKSSSQYWHLDKDILGSGISKSYSPENCCFIPQDLNKTISRFLVKSKGYHLHKETGKFRVKANDYDLGLFETEQEARRAWFEHRELTIRSILDHYKQSGYAREDVIDGVNNIIYNVERSLWAE